MTVFWIPAWPAGVYAGGSAAATGMYVTEYISLFVEGRDSHGDDVARRCPVISIVHMLCKAIDEMHDTPAICTNQHDTTMTTFCGHISCAVCAITHLP